MVSDTVIFHLEDCRARSPPCCELAILVIGDTLLHPLSEFEWSLAVLPSIQLGTRAQTGKTPAVNPRTETSA